MPDQTASELLSPDYQAELLRSLRELMQETRSAPKEARHALRHSQRKVWEGRTFGDLTYEVRDAGPNGDIVFAGYACITGEDDASYEMEDWLGSWVESVSRGSFGKTLNDRADILFLENHDGRPLCRVSDGRLSLEEHMAGTPTGLHTEARLNGSRHDVHDAMQAVRDGTYDQMSFAFRVVRQEWDEDFTRRKIQEVNMQGGDVSIVSFAANPHTAGTTGIRCAATPVRSAAASAVGPVALLLAHAEFRSWHQGMEWRAGKTLSTPTMSALQQVLDLVSDADDNVDQAQIQLASLMGVPNPDDDTQWQQNAATPVPMDTRMADLARLVERNRRLEGSH